MNKNTSVVGITTLISQTPHETALEKINTIFLPKISAENVEKERQERSEQLQKYQKYFLREFNKMILCIFRMNLTPWDVEYHKKVVELCTTLSVEELIAFEKSFSRYPIMKSAIGFFGQCSFWFRHFFTCMEIKCEHRKTFWTAKEYFYTREILVYVGGEKAIEKTLKEWHARITNECPEQKEKTKKKKS